MKLVMEPINGKVLKKVVDSFSSEELKTIFIQLGKEIVKMHNVNIVHGDLTTANILVKDKELYFIDFGLGNFSDKLEDKAVDLRVLRQALESKHHSHPDLFSFVLEGYSTTHGSKEVIQRLYCAVEMRGRYKRKNK
jgi:Kae1-associated kinase Bud32